MCWWSSPRRLFRFVVRCRRRRRRRCRRRSFLRSFVREVASQPSTAKTSERSTCANAPDKASPEEAQDKEWQEARGGTAQRCTGETMQLYCVRRDLLAHSHAFGPQAQVACGSSAVQWPIAVFSFYDSACYSLRKIRALLSTTAYVCACVCPLPKSTKHGLDQNVRGTEDGGRRVLVCVARAGCPGRCEVAGCRRRRKCF